MVFLPHIEIPNWRRLLMRAVSIFWDASCKERAEHGVVESFDELQRCYHSNLFKAYEIACDL